MEFMKKRETNIDVLRIICVCMIVVAHTCNMGGTVSIDDVMLSGTLNGFIGRFLFVTTLCGVNTFVLISGYYLCSQEFRLRKVTTIWIETAFYSVLLYLLFTLYKGNRITLSNLAKSVLCITQEQYWFVSEYILLLLVSPILNLWITKLGKEEYVRCCLIIFVVTTVIPNLPIYSYDILQIKRGFSFTWFCVLYFYAGYFRRFVPKVCKKQKLMLPAFFSCVVFGTVVLVLNYLVPATVYLGTYTVYNSIPILLCTFFLFQYFRGIEIENKNVVRVVNLASPLCFAVYLIHHNKNLKSMLWDVVDVMARQNSMIMIPYIIFCAIAIVLLCLFTVFLRLRMFEILGINSFVTKHSDDIQNYATKVYGAFLEKLGIKSSNQVKNEKD